jgi:PAS domain S-box-containing protein
METFALLRTEAPELPLIVLTGNQDDELAAKILREGAQDYLLKDEANGPLLARAIRHAIERHRVRVELNLRTSKLAESEATLLRARNRYFALFDRAPIGYMVFDASHSIKEVNTAATEVFGAAPDHAWDSCFYGCLGEKSRNVFSEHLKRVFDGETKEVAMVHIIGHEGTPRELHFESHLMQAESDGGAQCLSLFVDLTDQMRAENRLATALREKTVLLKEIHHRVKNNLQIISSLLNLQSRRITEPQTLEMFRESCDRIQLMALIHEKLYAGSDLSQLDFNDYLHSLAAMILRSYALKSRNVRVDFQLHQRLHLNLDTAIPLGLIASELISNSLKHAFPSGAKGTITLELTQADASVCTFRISDDGQGLPADFSMDQPASLGLRLVKMLAQQLHGELTWSRSPATSFTLVFPNRLKPREHNYEPAHAESS